MIEDVFYQAMLARDYRFDGKFFIGVKTTGIYCRPVCPAKPLRKNIEFLATAIAAENKGYRPCLRCRPESAPYSPAWNGTSAVVSRALKVISAEGFIESNEEVFASRFGVTARHLRRLFVEEVGQTPKQIASINRLNFARKLILESKLSMTTVAMNAGFSSLRRFNDAFKLRFHRSPTEIRKNTESTPEKGIELRLSYRPPFNWEDTLSFFRNHLITGIETVTDHSYGRPFQGGRFLVTHDQKNHCLNLTVFSDDPSSLFLVAQRVRRMFDLDSDPMLIAESFRKDKFMAKLWKKNPGLRVARGWDAFETSVCTILGQLVSVAVARTLVKELVENYGKDGLFPTPEILVKSDLKKIRTTEKRRDSIRALSAAVMKGEIDFTTPQDSREMKKKLEELPGIGRWSAEYISLRALGDTDAFPGTDLILKRAMIANPKIELKKIEPWTSYAAIYLWKEFA
ncbi:MAG: AlkA N-terminal domain-containing protein [Bdellovibrionota bacterium]